MIALMIVPALLLLLETNHVSLTQVAAETMPAATIVTEVGRFYHNVDARLNGVI
jgi:hypothetical protein